MQKKTKVKSHSTTQFFENRILRVSDVAEMLGYSKFHVYRLSNQKKLPSYKRGKTLFFMSEEIFEWIKEGAA